MHSYINFIAAVLIHEFSHILTAKILGVRRISISPKITGAILAFDFNSVGYVSEILVHISGGLGGIVSSILAYFLLKEEAHEFIYMSLILTCMNYLPINGLDGGGVIKSLLSIFFSPNTVYKITTFISFFATVILWGFSVWIEFKINANLSVIIFVLSLVLALK